MSPIMNSIAEETTNGMNKIVEEYPNMVGDTPKLANHKRIILCSDGTWLSSDLGDKAVPSNVAKIARAIAPNGICADGNIIKQVVYYHSGLGTGDLPFQKAIYGGIGWGLDNDVCQIYDFISNNYDAGDELFFFGFSRGAFTVRSVAGLVSDVGILSARHMDRFPEMWRAYRHNTNGEPFKKSTWYLDNKDELGLSEITIKVVGVWDTVGAMGIPEWPLVHYLQKNGVPINKEYAFNDTKASRNIEYAFQALAIDEKRLTFPPTLWHATEDAPSKELKQCWFPGVHGNIGGQAEMPRSAGDLEEIGDNTLAWMMDNLSGMLTFEYNSIQQLVEQHRRAINANHINNGWGCGRIVDNFSGLQGAFFWLLGRKDRTPGDYFHGEGNQGPTHETIHPTARIRVSKVRNWNPPPVRDLAIEEPASHRHRWSWVRKGVHRLPEYVMEPNKVMSVAYAEKGGKFRYGTEESLARRLCPSSILTELDEANKIHEQVAGL